MSVASNFKKKPIRTSFIDEQNTTGEAEFQKYLKAEGLWFSNLLYDIRREWVDKGFKVTDILIREDTPVLCALVKAHTPFKSYREEYHSDGGLVIPTKDDIVSIVKLLSASDDEDPRGVTIDFSFYVMGLGNFRGNFSVDSAGAGISLRYLSVTIPTFASIGYPEFYEKEIKRMVEKTVIKTPEGTVTSGEVKQGGLILHVGSTGSGKTTSIAGEISYFAEFTTGTIITYEDPIEYKFMNTVAPVRQYEIDVDIMGDEEHSVKDNIKRHAMRNNPSIVSFGEGRTKDDIRMMLETALKGHLVMGTIHASNVKEALTILSGTVVGEEHILTHAIKAIVAHKLYVNKSGSVIPIFEIWIPTEQDRVHLGNKETEKIISSLTGKDVAHPSGMSFQNHINLLVEQGRLSPSEATGITNALRDSGQKKKA